MILKTPKEQLIDYGKKIKRHRIQQKMTQADLAHEAGVGVQTISSLERGKGISLELFLKILRALEIDRELVLEPEVTTLSDLTPRGQSEPKRFKPCKKTRTKKYRIFG